MYIAKYSIDKNDERGWSFIYFSVVLISEEFKTCASTGVLFFFDWQVCGPMSGLNHTLTVLVECGLSF